MNHLYHGVTMTGAYHKVVHVSGNKDTLHVDIEIYQNSTEADARNKADEYSFRMETADMVHDDSANDKNYIKQAYEHMKAAAFNDLMGNVHDYTSAVDV